MVGCYVVVCMLLVVFCLDVCLLYLFVCLTFDGCIFVVDAVGVFGLIYFVVLWFCCIV